jgi:hypothetical protein
MLQDSIICVYSWLHLPDHNPFSSQMIYRTPPTSSQGYYVATRSHNWLESCVVVPFVSLGYLHVDSPVLGFLISCLIHRRTYREVTRLIRIRDSAAWFLVYLTTLFQLHWLYGVY